MGYFVLKKRAIADTRVSNEEQLILEHIIQRPSEYGAREQAVTAGQHLCAHFASYPPARNKV